jgi:hypothetical protein
MHQAIRWSSKDPLDEPDVKSIPWQIVKPSQFSKSKLHATSNCKKYTFIPAQGSVPIKVSHTTDTSLLSKAPVNHMTLIK